MVKPCGEKLNQIMNIGWQYVRIPAVAMISLSAGTWKTGTEAETWRSPGRSDRKAAMADGRPI